MDSQAAMHLGILAVGTFVGVLRGTPAAGTLAAAGAFRKQAVSPGTRAAPRGTPAADRAGPVGLRTRAEGQGTPPRRGPAAGRIVAGPCMLKERKAASQEEPFV